MAARRWLLCIVCCWAGCQPLQLFEEPKIATVSSNPFGLQAENRAAKISYQPADEALATRVDSVGRKLLAANPQIGLKSTLFATIGKAAQPEIFHVGANMVYVTEGLVKRCPTDAELAGVLALELGKIVAEREVAASPEMRNPDRLAPIQVPIGNSVQSAGSDLTYQAELARFEKERPRRRNNLPRPDPDRLARGYLDQAGFQSSDLDAVQPLLRAAQSNATLERQFKGTVSPGAWTP
jgi:hypothetical protein